MSVNPVIFIPDENNNRLEEILVERSVNFDVFWYHWPKDGDEWFNFLIREEDFEPVIVVYCNEEVVCVITRPHWSYQYYDIKDEELISPCEVLFKDAWHPAIAKTRQNEREFELIKSELIPHPYSDGDVREIERNALNQKFRTGIGHRSNFARRVMQDPIDVAQEAYEHYCAQSD